MSHTVTIQTRTVTSGNTSSIIVNKTYLRSWSGIVKLLQVALGIVCVGILGHHISRGYYGTTDGELFFLLMATTFMIASFILVLSCLCSLTTDSILSKTIYELIYHAIGFGLILAASLTLIIQVNKRYKNEALYGAAVCGLVNSVLYLFSTIVALRNYRGL